MDDSLLQILKQLSSTSDADSPNTGQNDLSLLRSQMPVGKFLAHIRALKLPSEQFLTTVYVLFKSASVEWLVPELDCSDQDNSFVTFAETSEHFYSDLATALCQHACVRSLANEEETCGDPCKMLGDRTGTACIAMKTFSCLFDSLTRCSCERELTRSCKRTVQRVVKNLSCGAVVICLEHELAGPWTTAQSVKCASSLLATLCIANGHDTLDSLLNMSDGKLGLLQHILKETLPKLTQTTWKLNPAAGRVFRRCLLLTRQPLFSDCLAMFLPPTLLFVDDFEAENRLPGLQCLHHIVHHCSRTELRWYGRADVIYDSLVRAMFGCDEVALQAVLFCLFDVLDIVETSPRRSTGPRTWCRHDELFSKYLTNMEMESRLPIRRTYAKHLGAFISKLGITTVRHLSQLVRVVVDYLQFSDGQGEQCRCDILDALLVILSESWPRVSSHADEIMKSLVRLLDDVGRQTDSSSVQMGVQRRALDCVQLLKKICPEYEDLTDDFFLQIAGD